LVEAGKVITTYKTGKHFAVTITDASLTVTRKQDQIDAEARSPRPAAPRRRRPRPLASTIRPGSPTSASAACSSTWPR
jgi:hypothetical protein